jgi:hypothetical protein
LVLVSAALGLGWLIARAARGWALVQRIGAAALPLAAVIVVWTWLATIGFQPVVGPWSAARLAPALGLKAGYKLYTPPDSGPAIGWIYPPVATLAYLPATLVPDATGAVLAGRMLSLLYYYAPVAWLILTRRGPRSGADRVARCQVLVLFALLTYQSRPLRYVSTEIHADAPALCLGAFATGLMARSRADSARWRRGVSLILATLSVWAKQLTAPILLIVLPVWALATGGLKGLFQYAVAAVTAGLGLTVIFLAVFDAPSILFNILTVPRLHPWRITALVEFTSTFLDLQNRHLVLLLVLVVGGLGQLVLRPWTDDSPDGIKGETWLLFLLVGLAEMPLALVGYAKVGGDDNNLAFLLYFLAIAAVLMLDRLVAREQDALRSRAAPGLSLLVLGLNLVLTLLSAEQTVLALAFPGPGWQEQQKTALRFIEHHRGEVYLPWNPLEHLVVEGKLYHFEYGVFDRDLAGYPLAADHFRRHIPGRTRLVCYPPQTTVGDRITLRYLNEFQHRVEVAELPGWECYQPVAPGG